MAPLTWRNVDAPNFSGVTSSLATASQLLNNATSGLSDAIDKRRNTQRMGDSSAAIAQALQLGDEGALQAALPGILANGRNLTPEALQIIGARQGQLIQNEGSRLANTGAGIRNDTASWNLKNTQSEQARLDGQRAAQPAANARMVEIRNLFGSANPEDQARAQRLYGESSELFSKAGIGLDTQLDQLGEGFRASDAGRGQLAAQQAEQDRLRERGRVEGQRGIVDGLVSGPSRAAGFEDAVSKVNALNLDAKTKDAVLKDITEKKDTYFPAPTAYDQLNASPTAAQDILSNAAGNRGASRANTPQSTTPTFDRLRQRTEAGSYDTLYGNSNRPGGRYEGIQPSKMTIAEVMDFQKNSDYGDWVKANNPKGARATPVGGSQIVGTTLRNAVKEMGLDPNTLFDGATQEAITMHIAKSALGRATTMDGKIEALKGQWDGFRGQSRAELEQAVREIEGTAIPSASTLMRDSVIRGGGQRTGSTVQTPGAPQPLQITQPTYSDNGGPTVIQAAIDEELGVNAAAPLDDRNQLINSALTSLANNGAGVRTDTNGNTFTGTAETGFTQTTANGVPVGGGEAYQPAATAALGAVDRPAQAPARTPASEAQRVLTAAETAQLGRTMANTGAIDRNLDPNAPINAALQNVDPNEAPGSVAKRLTGENGSLSTVRQNIVEDAINRLMARDPTISAAAAGALLENSKETADLRSWYNFFGDPLKEGNSEQRLNVDRALETWRNYRTTGNNNPGQISRGVGQLDQQDRQRTAQAQVETINAQIVQLQAIQQQLVQKIQADQARGLNPVEDIARLRQATAQIESQAALLRGLQGNIAPNSTTAISRR